MQITVNVIDVSQEETKMNKAGKPYGMLEVTFKDQSNKVSNKKLMSFQNPDVYKVFKEAQRGEVYTVESVKEGDYWQWKQASKGGAAPAASNTTTSAPATGGTSRGSYETPEERARRQVLIVRQSSLSNAVETLTVGAKGGVKSEDVKKLAQEYVDWVMGNEVKETSKDPMDGLEDGIPY